MIFITSEFYLRVEIDTPGFQTCSFRHSKLNSGTKLSICLQDHRGWFSYQVIENVPRGIPNVPFKHYPDT